MRYKNNNNFLVILSVIIGILTLVAGTIYITVIANSADDIETIETANIENSGKEEPEVLDELEIELDEEQEASIEDFEEQNGTAEVFDVNSNSQYYIRINNEANVVTIYAKDSEGKYSKPVKAMICSTGKATPKSGQYQVKGKYRWIRLFGNVHGQYSKQITGNILFHSVPYTQYGNPGSLEYWEYDKLGTSASMGCVRLTIEDAKWIYDNISDGTIVEFYSDSNPGPLGKPTAQQISGNTNCRNWDPTDPDTNNPWRGGSGATTNQVQQQTTTRSQTTKSQQKSVVQPSQTPAQNQIQNQSVVNNEEATPTPTPAPIPTPTPTQEIIQQDTNGNNNGQDQEEKDNTKSSTEESAKDEEETTKN